MTKTDLKDRVEEAQRAEASENFFNASVFYKEALALAIKTNDSKLIKVCKSKVVEMNKKSIDSGKDFKEVEISVDFSEDDQKAIKENIEKIVGLANIDTALEAIGSISWFCPDIKEIEEQLMKRGKKEIKSSIIGELVMKKIKKLDNIAYIRFASVYRDFKDINDFKKELKYL